MCVSVEGGFATKYMLILHSKNQTAHQRTILWMHAGYELYENSLHAQLTLVHRYTQA